MATTTVSKLTRTTRAHNIRLPLPLARSPSRHAKYILPGFRIALVLVLILFSAAVLLHDRRVAFIVMHPTASTHHDLSSALHTANTTAAATSSSSLLLHPGKQQQQQNTRDENNPPQHHPLSSSASATTKSLSSLTPAAQPFHPHDNNINVIHNNNSDPPPRPISLASASSSSSLAAATLSEHPPTPPPRVRILIVVRTCPRFYETRLRTALETYLVHVPTHLILPVGNTPHSLTVPAPGPANHTRVVHVLPTDGSSLQQLLPHHYPNHSGTSNNTNTNDNRKDGLHANQQPDPSVAVCQDNHGPGIVCIEGRALHYAYQRLATFDWLFVLDDDVYLFYDHLVDHVATLDPDLRHVYTIGGCAPTVSCAHDAGGGICGGGGWLMSARNLQRAWEHDGGAGSSYVPSEVTEQRRKVAKGTDVLRWMEAWTDTGAGIAKEDGSWWSDITAGCVLHERGGITVQRLEGIHPWPVAGKDVDAAMAAHAPPPISYHYVGRDGTPSMQELHKLIHHHPTSTV